MKLDQKVQKNLESFLDLPQKLPETFKVIKNLKVHEDSKKLETLAKFSIPKTIHPQKTH
jgi:hypothetical protein